MSIPKIIHYCWFGGKGLPESAEKCIDSWKKFFPDYEIKEWNESNFDINYCDYTKEAYEAKKWAFVSDVARFKILHENGGLYFDTDVEVIKPFDDIISSGAFMGVESDKDCTVAPGLGLGVEAGNQFYKEMLDLYCKRHFKLKDGNFDTTTIVHYTTSKMKSYGLKKSMYVQKVCDINIYPKRFFNPKGGVDGKLVITEETYSIHHYDASWFSKEENYAKSVIEKCGKFLPKKIAGHIGCFIAECRYRGFCGAVKNIFVKIKRKKKA